MVMVEHVAALPYHPQKLASFKRRDALDERVARADFLALAVLAEVETDAGELRRAAAPRCPGHH